MKPAICLLAPVLVVLPAAGQSINIDLGHPGAPPPAGYRAAGMPGQWNKFEAVDPDVEYQLVGLDGLLTAATVDQFGGTEIVESPLGGPGEPAGADAILLGDALVTHTTVENCLFFHGLAPGTYEVTTYAWMASAPGTLNRVHIDFNPTVVDVGGAWTGTHAQGVTFARHLVEVTDGFLGPHSGVPPGGNFGIGAALDGIQLRRVTDEPPLFPAPGGWSWLVALDALRYDVVRGDLGLLRATAGDFAAATTGCAADNTSVTTLASAETPAPGEGLWYLVRGVAPQGSLTWDAPGGSQFGSRDPGIAAAPGTCP